MRTVLLMTVFFVCCVSNVCGHERLGDVRVNMEQSVIHEGHDLKLIAMTNSNGMMVKVCNYAATLSDVVVPDKYGNFGHVVLGFDSITSYVGRHPKLGATVGRYANRIRNAQFSLDRQIYHLDRNSKGHCIHGGANGFYRQLFDIDTFYAVKDTAVCVMSYYSPHGEGGFPGNVHVKTVYRLTNENEVIIEYMAVTDRPTVMNMTNHTYFNLSGCDRNVLEHTYMIKADSIVAVDSDGLPAGHLESVGGTGYDFRLPRKIASDITDNRKSYDICYSLNKTGPDLLQVAEVVDSVSGRMLRAYTTEPGMQFYIPASNLDYIEGHQGKHYSRYYGFCLEMQHFPDSPNHVGFPSVRLEPGQVYRQKSVYRFGIIND